MNSARPLFVALAVLCPATVSAQAISAVTSPATSTSIKAANDFATRAFQDPWDMNQKTDVGPFLGSNDASSSNWSNILFTNGLFSGTTTAGDAQLWLLDTGNPLAAPLGKTGTNFPIDANTYKVFAFRMTRPAGAGGTQAQVLTWPNNIYQSSPTPHFTGSLPGGSGVYFIDLDRFSPASAPGSGNWTGLQRALRLQPTAIGGESVSVDWARLVQMDANSCQRIAWTGGTGADNVADIYIDTDNTLSNGYYGIVQAYATTTALGAGSRASAGCPVVSGAFNFNVGALPAGTYYALVAPLGVAPTAANSKYSAGSWTIGDVPTLKFTSPSDEGSSDDFATSQMGDAWDFDKVTDIDTLYNINNPQIVTLNMEAPDGTPLPGQRVFMGASAPAGGCPTAGDPVLQMTDFSKRGKTFLIDTTRYRLMTVEFGMPNKARDLVCGSVARVIWHKKGDAVNAFTVSDDIIFNSRVGVNLLDKITVDLATLNTEPRGPNDGPNPSWTNGPGGGVDAFRFDPLEFAAATNFYVKRIKLADYERAKTSYTITWTYSQSVGTVNLYYDTDNAGFNGTEITPGAIDATLGTFTWDVPANLPTAGGTPYYIYAVFRDAPGCVPASVTCNTNQVYAPLPVLMDSNFTQRKRLVLSRQTLNFGAQALTSTVTAPQTVRLSFVGTGTTPCWTISSSSLNYTVSPQSGSGNATVTVGLVPQVFGAGGGNAATFTVNECNPAVSTMLNPGQTFTANFTIVSGAAPIGAVDTPANGITVEGSLGITGWVVDDIDVAAVSIYRDAVAGEAPGLVYLGDASRVDDARPDIEAANPTRPFNYRGGWGYLVLTNFLPGLGNGTFTFSAYAADRDGHQTLLGQRTIIAANSVSTTPFGAIDTPGQGETISGSSYANFGWVLVQGSGPSSPHADPPHGGTVSVFVDGAFVGNPGGWSARSDLSSLFPKAQYDGIDNALGAFILNTTAYTDGLHTISWLVVATNGKAAGVGSRYFTTVNGNNLALTDSASANLGRTPGDVAALDRSSGVRANRNGSVRPASPIAADPAGLRTVYGRHLERVVVDASTPGAHRYEAYQVVDGTLRALPAGASFDDRRGVLYWQPGLGYVGDYDFMVVKDGKSRIPVRVVLSPDEFRAPVSRLVRGLFATN